MYVEEKKLLGLHMPALRSSKLATTSIEERKLAATLKGGRWPLLIEGEKQQWKYMVQELGKGPDTFVEKILGKEEALKFYGGSVWLANGEEFRTGFSIGKTFTCAAHARLCKVFGEASHGSWQPIVQGLRRVLKDYRMMDESDVKLIESPHTRMGGGLTGTRVSLLPDPALGETFGSVPNQSKIANDAACWKTIKLRQSEDRSGKLRSTPHYVLGHLLNHNLNGSGNNHLNLVPLWTDGNKEMSSKVEEPIKLAVNQGINVKYTIVCGSPMYQDPGYKAWYDSNAGSGTSEQQAILAWEKELPQYLECSASAIEVDGTSVNIVPPTLVKNYVPQTMPTMTI